MLGKTSVSMMVLLLAVPLIGISSIHQYIEGQIATEPLTEPPATTPTPKPQQAQKQSAAGSVRFVSIYETSQGKFCVASVLLPSKEANKLGLSPGSIDLYAPSESCALLGLSKIGKTQISFDAQKMSPSSQDRVYKATRVTLH